MNKFYHAGIIGILISLAFSCSKPEKDDMLLKIDSLQTSLKQLEENMQEITIRQAKDMYATYSMNVNKLKKYIDTQKEDSLFIDLKNYSFIRTPLKKFVKKQPKWEEEIAYTRKQLDDLYQDVTTNAISPETFTTYFNSEAEAIAQLNNEIPVYVKHMKEQMVNFDTLNPRIEEIIKNLKAYAEK